MYVCGRKLRIVTGAKSQTVNICTSANIPGKYDYTVRLRPPYISAETIAYGNFNTIHDFVHFLELSHGGQVEQWPATQPADGSRTGSLTESVSALDRESTVTSKFGAWRDKWDQLSLHGRITDVIDLWHAPVPDSWMRSESDVPLRLLAGERYTRGNRNGPRRGEHVIEHQILVEYFDSAKCLDQPLLDAVNAFPLVKDDAGGRSNNVEADVVLLTGKPDSARIFVCDVKVSDGNPWKALLQNLRQLRLFTSNPICAAFFGLRGSTAKVVQICGGVIAPDSFYSPSGRDDDRLSRAKSLSDVIAKPPTKVTAELLVWDAVTGRLFRRV